METSFSQVQTILGNEGFVPTAYADGMVSGVQMYSIGYGHQIQPGESYLLTASIDADKAMDLFRNDLSPVEDKINNYSDWPFSQSEFDALVDFGYNCGVGALQKVLDTWNDTHDPVATTEHMKLYNKTRKNGTLVVDNGLVQRRQSEANQFLSTPPPAGDATGSNSGMIAAGCVLAAVVGCYFLFA